MKMLNLSTVFAVRPVLKLNENIETSHIHCPQSDKSDCESDAVLELTLFSRSSK